MRAWGSRATFAREFEADPHAFDARARTMLGLRAAGVARSEPDGRKHASADVDVRTARMRSAIAISLVRVGVCVSPVLVLAAVTSDGDWTALLALAALAGIAFRTSLRYAYSPRFLPPAVGNGFKSTVGAALGLGILLITAGQLPALALSPAVALLSAVVVVPLSAATERLASRSAAERQRILIVGRHGGGVELARRIAADDRPFEVIGILDVEEGIPPLQDVRTFPFATALSEIVAGYEPSMVVLADEQPGRCVIDELLDTRALNVRIIGLPGFYEHAYACVPLPSISSKWFMTVLHVRQPRYAGARKRTFDIVFAIVGITVLLPLFPIVAALLRLSGPGPIFFSQRRLGEGGRPFSILKFRTMGIDAEAHGAAVWAVENDPRVTRLGAILRRSHVDELPQVWNILRGEMSVVGPRPERPEFMSLLQAEIPFWMRRNLMKPGLTGWAQIGHGYTSTSGAAASKLSLDLWYLNNQSLALDLAIIASTAGIGVRGLVGHTSNPVRRSKRIDISEDGSDLIVALVD
jgi:exopolysaccharide biosynthesis polyprenyl glycosylphosphotransferase